MTTPSAFLDYCMPELPGASPVLVLQTVMTMLIEFCESTLAWAVDIDPLTVSPGVNEYDLEAPVDDARIIKVISLTSGKKVFTPLTPDQALERYGDWRSIAETRRGTPVGYVQSSPTIITLVPCPAEALGEAVTGRVALKPTRNAAEIDDDLFEDWVTTIASGVKAMMLKTSNPRESGIQAGLYDAGVSKALARASTGNTRAIQQVRIPRI